MYGTKSFYVKFRDEPEKISGVQKLKNIISKIDSVIITSIVNMKLEVIQSNKNK